MRFAPFLICTGRFSRLLLSKTENRSILKHMTEVPNGTRLSREKLIKLCTRYERELVGAKDWMFWFLIVWTLVLLAMEWAHFFTGRAVPPSMVAGYGVLLGAYIAHKEALRWTGITAKVRRGEFFVYIWWGILLTMYVFQYAFGKWVVSDGMNTLAYEVLGYFVVTEISKSLNAWRTARVNGIAKEEAPESS